LASIKKNNLTIYYDTFQKPKLIGALLMLLFGFALHDTYVIVGKILIFTCIIPPFYNDGIELDPKQKKYRYFTSYFGLKSGTWKSLSMYNYIIIKLQRGSRELIGARGAIATTVQGEQYEIAIVNETHGKHLMLKHFDKKEAAIQFAKNVSNTLNFPITKYSPKLSSKTEERRRKR